MAGATRGTSATHQAVKTANTRASTCGSAIGIIPPMQPVQLVDLDHGLQRHGPNDPRAQSALLERAR